VPRGTNARAGDPVDLVLAICHELGNLLAATRLAAHLLARESRPERVREGADDVEEAAAQAGALLGPARALLARRRPAPVRVAPDEVLRAAEQSLSRIAGVSVARGTELPDVRIDPDSLHHVLVTLAFAARDVSIRDVRVSVSAARGRGSVTFAVEDDGPPFRRERPGRGATPHGRDLALAVAARLVQPWRGRVAVARRAGRTRIEIRLPAKT
jgi:signal transduction histidine kinase